MSTMQAAKTLSPKAISCDCSQFLCLASRGVGICIEVLYLSQYLASVFGLTHNASCPNSTAPVGSSARGPEGRGTLHATEMPLLSQVALQAGLD